MSHGSKTTFAGRPGSSSKRSARGELRALYEWQEEAPAAGAAAAAAAAAGGSAVKKEE